MLPLPVLVYKSYSELGQKGVRLENLFCPILRTLDNMEAIIKIGFQDYLFVASGLVKNLALNTRLDAIESLVKSNAVMKTEIA